MEHYRVRLMAFTLGEETDPYLITGRVEADGPQQAIEILVKDSQTVLNLSKEDK